VIGAGQLLQPLHKLMRDALLESPFIHVDKTVVQVGAQGDKSLPGLTPKRAPPATQRRE
jgi:hypothetical protein